MNDVIAPEAPPKTTFTELNVRQEQGSPHFVRLNDNVVKRLERQLIDKPPVTGSERFGLLLGSIQAGDHCTIAVEDFEPAARLEELIGSWTPSQGSQHRIVGYYRSYREADFAPDQSDRALFERCFPTGSRVILLVKPRSGDAGTAMFFVGESGQLGAGRATVEFPFNLRELGAEDAPPPAVEVAPGSVAKPVVLAAVKPVPGASAAKPAPASAPQPTPMPAAVAAEPQAQKAASGSGGVMLKIAVAGAVVIASVFGLSELRVFKGSAPVTPPTTASAIATESKPVVQTPVAQPQPQPEQTPLAPEPQPVKAVAAQPAKQPKPKLDQSPAAAPVVPVSVPALPILVAQNPIPSPTAVPQQRSLTPVFMPPSPAPSPKALEASLPVTPPHAIRQFAPVLPDKVSRAIVGEVVVRVKASVDAAGKVTSAEPVAGGGPASDTIVGTAVNAVKRWQFEPARRGDEKVAGDVVLSFIFRK